MDYLETTDPAATCPRPARRGCAYLDDPDVQLMLRVQAGDGPAFSEIQNRYSPKVFGRLFRLLRNRAEAEDLTQDVFLRLYRSRLRYRPRARFGTWVYHVTQNVARNALRSRQRRALLGGAGEGPCGRPRLETLLVDPAAPSGPVERDELAGIVRAAVAGLAGQQRAAVELCQLQGRSYAEVGAELGLTATATKSLLYRARMQLRKALQFVGG